MRYCRGTLCLENTPKDEGGIEGITYNLLADSNRNLSAILGILDSQNEHDEETGTVLVDGDNVSYRATYIIDEEGVVFHEGVNHMPIGRNVNEYLRIIDALTHVQEKGEVCPANWEDGKDAMNANRDSVQSYLSNAKPLFGMLEEIKDDSQQLVASQSKVIVQYSAGWCGNCRIRSQIQENGGRK